MLSFVRNADSRLNKDPNSALNVEMNCNLLTNSAMSVANQFLAKFRNKNPPIHHPNPSIHSRILQRDAFSALFQRLRGSFFALDVGLGRPALSVAAPSDLAGPFIIPSAQSAGKRRSRRKYKRESLISGASPNQLKSKFWHTIPKE
jgi:hypothetical protein